MGSPCAMIFIAWVIRKVKYPLNLLASILSGIAFHAYTIFPYCVVVYGWELTPLAFTLQLIGGLIVVVACFLVAFGGATYMWRFIPPEEKFSVASKKRILAALIFAIVTSIVAYGICFTPYVFPEVAGPSQSPYRLYLDAWVRHPITLGSGWLFWELYKKNAEWFSTS